MAERLPDRPRREHPVLAGLAALVGVGLALGLVLGGVVLAATAFLGVGEGSDSGSSSDTASLYLPKPVKTEKSDGPEITLETESPSGDASADGSESSSDATDKPEKPKREITLSASTTEVSSMQEFQLTGIYPRGEGAILTVQRFESGGWVTFPATGSVSGETFQIPVQASRPGPNRFRVVDSDTGLTSDPVRVTVTG